MPPAQRAKRSRGFTLIELLVVVMMMGILAAVAVPILMKVVSSKKKVLAARKAVAQQALQMRQMRKTEKGMVISHKELPSSVFSTDVKVNLQVSYLLEQGQVIPVYQAEFEGEYILHNPLRKRLYAMVSFPFPRGAGTFSNLQFLTSPPKVGISAFWKVGPSSRPSSQPLKSSEKLTTPRFGVRITPAGVYWQRRFAPGEQVKVKIKYKVRGRDKYQYLIAPGKKKKFHFRLAVSGVDPEIPPSALQPSMNKRDIGTQQIVNRYQWRFDNFLSTEHIEVRFPPQYSKYYRFALLGKLGVIALLFFALFFWFFGEKHAPENLRSGRKTQINMGLLLLGFISFFPLLIFLEDHISLTRAMVIALSTAVLLTTGHVATFMGLRWAMVVSLPLQLFFTAGFTFAVLVPTYRPLAFTVGAVILVAFIIVAHARFQKEKEQQEAEEALLRAEREAEEARQKARNQQQQERLSPQSAAEVGASEEAPAPKYIPIEAPKITPKSQYCLFCRCSVDPHFKHCQECGKRLKRSHHCGTCNEEYWYPSVQEFSYCRQCGSDLHPGMSPLDEAP